MSGIEQTVRQIQRRQQRQCLWQFASTGLLVGGFLGIAISVARLVLRLPLPWPTTAAAVVLPAIAGIGWGIFKSPTLFEAAQRIDHRGQLKDRIQTAMQFLQLKAQSSIQKLQIEDAEQILAALPVETISPIVAPRSWPAALITSVIAMALTVLTVAPTESRAALVSSEVVAAQANSLQQQMEELEEFQLESPDPELEALLREMNRHVSMLREPGVAPKEAMATLSEMDAALQEMQQQLKASSSEASLKEIGEALSLAESTAKAGEALEKGDLGKAADELQKASLPAMDRKTETAVSEKLEKAQQSAKKNVAEAVQKLAEGIKAKDEDAFNEGKSALAKESRMEDRKQELKKRLGKQSQQLAESKEALATEMRAPSSSSKNGETPAPGNEGRKAGKGTQGNPKTQPTKAQQTDREMKLTGEDLQIGDAETETEMGTEEDSEAVREYRQNSGKYEALNESALESEAIPPGHRQTIRRYFELIRPTDAETNAVKEQLP